MSWFLIPFDPTSAVTNTLVTSLGKDAGTILVQNDSAVNVLFTLGDGSRKFSPAQSWRRFDLEAGNDPITWTQQAILSGLAVPNSQVYVEAMFAAEAENLQEVFPTSFVRSITGNVQGLVAQYLTNTGIAAQPTQAPTQVVDIANTTNAGILTIDNQMDTVWQANYGTSGLGNILTNTAVLLSTPPPGALVLGNTLLSGASGGFVTSVKGQLQGQVLAVGGTAALGALQTGIASQAFAATPSAVDMAGRVNITTTGSPPGANAPVAIVDFGLTYGTAPHSVQLEAAGVYATYFVTNITSSGFTINTGAALTGSTTYGIYYTVIF